jgi:hypothetical protein
VSPETEQPRINPFHEFLEAAEDIRHHYRELSKTNFENTLAQKWIVSSLIQSARVHWGLILKPPAGTEHHIDDVEEAMRWLISWLPEFFPEQNQPASFHINEAADSLACLGISLLEHDRIESAQACASAIAGLAANVAAQHPQPYIIADLHQRLEILARAADGLRKAPAAVTIRAMILPGRAARQLPDQSITLWVESSSTNDSRLGVRPGGDITTTRSHSSISLVQTKNKTVDGTSKLPGGFARPQVGSANCLRSSLFSSLRRLRSEQ